MCITLFTPEEVLQAAMEAAGRKKSDDYEKLMAIYHKLIDERG